MAKYYYDMTQGDEAWFKIRIGIPTASEFGKIITPNQSPTKAMIEEALQRNGIEYVASKRKDDLLELLASEGFGDDFPMVLSGQFDKYMYGKIFEIMTGESMDYFEPTYWMERGKTLEPQALTSYQFTQDVEIQRVGFVTDDNGWFGASPDFLVGDDGCGEIKCLSGPAHLEVVHKQMHKPDHICQVQGQLYICEREWSDYVPYHPDLPVPPPIRTYRDESYIKRLEAGLMEFRERMNDAIEDLQKRGLWQLNGVIAERTEQPTNLIMAG